MRKHRRKSSKKLIGLNTGCLQAGVACEDKTMRDLLLSLVSRAYMLISSEPRITVVTLHRVGHLSKIQPGHVARCFQFLSDHFRLVRPSELDFGEPKGRVAVVTIDDGHADVYQHIFPIARAKRIPISLCIPTDFFFRKRWLWFDIVTWVMHHAKPTAKTTLNGQEIWAENPSSFEKFKHHLKKYPPPSRAIAIQDLLHSLDLKLPSSPSDEYRALTMSELRKMLSSGLIELVGHTVTHTVATALDDKDFETELRQSKEEWESFWGNPIVSFCYPNGLPGDFNERTALAVRKGGYRCAFTSVEGTNQARTMDPFEMKRIHIHPRAGVCDKLVSGLADLQNSPRLSAFFSRQRNI